MSMLDDMVFSSALAQARRLLKKGYGAEKAAKYACPGAWKIYRNRVLARISQTTECIGAENLG